MSEYKTKDFDNPKVCDDLICDFKCYFLFLLFAQSNKGKHFMPGSQKQMLSNVFNHFHKEHPAVIMFDQDKYPVEAKWYVENQKSCKRIGFNTAMTMASLLVTRQLEYNRNYSRTSIGISSRKRDTRKPWLFALSIMLLVEEERSLL